MNAPASGQQASGQVVAVMERKLGSLRHAMHSIAAYMESETVVEIMLNPDGRLWVDEVGKGMHEVGVMKPSDAEHMIKLIAGIMDKVCNFDNPSLAGKIPVYGARFQALIPPVVEYPTFAIRKHAKFAFPLSDYLAKGILTAGQCDYLKAAVHSRKNILLVGGTGSGKTTFGNALLMEIAETSDRVYLIEDTLELQCAARNKVGVLVQPPTYTWQLALKDVLRMRPDRIILGELRDGTAALELVDAWSTAHPGGLATFHADNAETAMNRLKSLIERVAVHAPVAQIAAAIGVLVVIQRDKDHPAGRRITEIAEVRGMGSDGQWDIVHISPD